MSTESKSATKTCIVGQGRRKIHTTFANDEEMVEEYDMKTDELVERRWRRKSKLGVKGPWEWEIGQQVQTFNADKDLIDLSSKNPSLVRLDSKDKFLWRIRNLPYASSVYSVEVDAQTQEIVVRTSNKKYFKRISLPDLAAVKVQLDNSKLSWSHANNTLAIEYVKPKEVVAVEAARLEEAKKLKPMIGGDS